MNAAICILITQLFFLTATATTHCWETMGKKSQHSVLWPEDGRPVDNEVLIGVIRSELASIEPRRKPDVALGSVVWKGQQKILGISVSERDLADRFGAESLKYHKDNGRDVLHVAIRTYLDLGMEQGRRDFLNLPEFQKLLSMVPNLKDIVEKKPINPTKFMESVDQIRISLLEIKDLAEIEIFQATRKKSASYFKIQDLIESYYTLDPAQSQQLRQSLLSMSHYGRQQGVRFWYSSTKKKLLSVISSIERNSEFFSPKFSLSDDSLNELAMIMAQELIVTAAFLASN